jgi:hydroxymethylpyrimidine pyrophosphatase-like HAD family hydrolase
MKQAAYIFDVDGVINDIHTYQVDNRVLAQISQLLDNGCYVAINTGRGYAWVEEDVIGYLKKQPGAPASLNRMFVSVEMGGLTVGFTDGAEHHERTAFSLLPEQIEKVKELYERYRVDGVMHWYEGKLSMATIDKPAGVDPQAFIEQGRTLTTALQKEFADDHVKIKHNPDAIDVTTPEAGKWAGAQLIYDWLQHTPAAEFSHFICFGDNSSDYEMARFFSQQKHSVEFVFTGTSLGDTELDPDVKITKTAKPYNEGTYEYLLSHIG